MSSSNSGYHNWSHLFISCMTNEQSSMTIISSSYFDWCIDCYDFFLNLTFSQQWHVYYVIRTARDHFCFALRRKKTKKPWFNLSDRSRNNRIIVHYSNGEKMRQPLHVRLISWFSNPDWGEVREDWEVCSKGFYQVMEILKKLYEFDEVSYFLVKFSCLHWQNSYKLEFSHIVVASSLKRWLP